MAKKITYYFGGAIHKPLYFEAVEEASTVALNKSADDASLSATLRYSYDNCSWEDYTWDGTSGLVINLLPGEKVYFKGNNETFSNSSSNYIFAMTGKIEAHGNVMSLLDESMLRKDIPTEYCFKALFRYCDAMTTAPEMPAEALKPSCYRLAFSDCSGLIIPPNLPAQDLQESCYRSMFQNCVKLQECPEITSPEVPEYAYALMFKGCSSLKETPALYSTNIGEHAYDNMFYECTALKNVTALPAMTVPAGAYNYMFYGCSALENCPPLPATEIGANAYSYMFKGCSSLKNAPAKLPATIVPSAAYYQMFCQCSALENCPQLPATDLGVQCYRAMFQLCTSLKTATPLSATTVPASGYMYMFAGCSALTGGIEELPATEIGANAYESMFMNDTSLTKAPAMKFTTIATDSLDNTFDGCTHLNEIEVNFSSWKSGSTGNWVRNVAASGTFKCPADLPETRGNNNIPTNWTIDKPAPPPFNLLVSYKEKDDGAQLADDAWMMEMTVGTVINAIPIEDYRCINTPHTVDLQDAAQERFVFEYEPV